MSQSWGHTIRPLTEADDIYEREWDTETRRFVRTQEKRKCSTGKCGEPVAFETTYQYVTGRAGRVSYARKMVCEQHAEKFRAKYQPAEMQAPAPHASEQALGQLLGGRDASG